MLADAIVEVTETGSSLRANKLRIIETVLESNTQLIANVDSWKDAWKRRKLEDIKHAAGGRDQRAGQGRADAERRTRESSARCWRCCPR